MPFRTCKNENIPKNDSIFSRHGEIDWKILKSLVYHFNAIDLFDNIS